MKAVIIAGGLGTRLRPLTYNTPKCLVPVLNRPFIFYQIELLKKHGIQDIIINLHYQADLIQATLSEEEKIGVKFYYSLEESALGTGGAVKNAEEFFDDEPLIVLNGDILTDINLGEMVEFHKKNKSTATISAVSVEDPTHYGLIITDENKRIKKFLEKPNWESVTTNRVNAGVYIIDPKVFKKLPKNTNISFEREIFPSLLMSGDPMYSYEMNCFWLDIGDSGKYMLGHRAILRGDIEVKIEGTCEKGNIWKGENAQIAADARIRGPMIIGRGCNIKSKANVDEFSVLGNNVTINEGAAVKYAVIWDGVKIGKNSKIANCVIGKNSVIEDNVLIDGMIVLADDSLVRAGSKLGG